MLGYGIALVTAIYMVFFSEKSHILYASVINKTIAVIIVFAVGTAAYRVGGWLRRGMTSDVVTTDQGCLVALPLMLVWNLALNLVLCLIAAFVTTLLYFSAFGVTGQKLFERRLSANLAKSEELVEGWKATHKTVIEQWERDYPVAYGPNYANSQLAKRNSPEESKNDRIFTPEQQRRMLTAKILLEARHDIETTSKNKNEWYAMSNAGESIFAELKNEGVCFLYETPRHRDWRPCYKPSIE